MASDGHLPDVNCRPRPTILRLAAGLRARGYSDADIGKILGGNLLRTWAEIEAGATGNDPRVTKSPRQKRGFSRREDHSFAAAFFATAFLAGAITVLVAAFFATGVFAPRRAGLATAFGRALP